MSKPLKIASFGEVLWDLFPDKQRLGGAPLNVALRLQSFGAEVAMISAVGTDELGKETLNILKGQRLSTTLIQKHTSPTGTVQVSLDDGGSPSYEIAQDVAWDNISNSEDATRAVSESDALVIGSLAFRESVNQLTLQELLEASKYTIFDLNLRTPFYDLNVVGGLMEVADFIKMNDEELELIVVTLGIDKDSLEEELKAVAQITETKSICVTLGEEGAMLLHNDKIYTQKGYKTKVVDTVGAGDSFLAGLIFGILSGENPQDCLAVACAVGALVASKAGANPEILPKEIDNLVGW